MIILIFNFIYYQYVFEMSRFLLQIITLVTALLFFMCVIFFNYSPKLAENSKMKNILL